MKQKSTWITVLLAVPALVAGIIGGAAIAASASGGTPQPSPTLHAYPIETNASGQTYGSEAGAVQPDLVLVTGDTGKVGYVYSSELNARPKSPAEAVQWTAERLAGKDLVFNVYESDGKTAIDTFTESASDQDAQTVGN